MTNPAPPSPAPPAAALPGREAIVEAALDMAEADGPGGWSRLQLHALARALGITLRDLQAQFDGKDAIAEAWFDRADRALLAAAEAPDWLQRSARERLQALITAWLDELGPHHALAGEMLRYKVQPEHLHLQVGGLLRISRTVQWLREAAALPSAGWRREAEEAVLSAIFVATVLGWLGDRSPGFARTHDALARRLAAAESAASRWPFAGKGQGDDVRRWSR